MCKILQLKTSAYNILALRVVNGFVAIEDGYIPVTPRHLAELLGIKLDFVSMVDPDGRVDNKSQGQVLLRKQINPLVPKNDFSANRQYMVLFKSTNDAPLPYSTYCSRLLGIATPMVVVEDDASSTSSSSESVSSLSSLSALSISTATSLTSSSSSKSSSSTSKSLSSPSSFASLSSNSTRPTTSSRSTQSISSSSSSKSISSNSSSSIIDTSSFSTSSRSTQSISSSSSSTSSSDSSAPTTSSQSTLSVSSSSKSLSTQSVDVTSTSSRSSLSVSSSSFHSTSSMSTISVSSSSTITSSTSSSPSVSESSDSTSSANDPFDIDNVPGPYGPGSDVEIEITLEFDPGADDTHTVTFTYTQEPAQLQNLDPLVMTFDTTNWSTPQILSATDLGSGVIPINYSITATGRPGVRNGVITLDAGA